MKLKILSAVGLAVCLNCGIQNPELTEALQEARQAIVASDDALAQKQLARAVDLAAQEGRRGPRLVEALELQASFYADRDRLKEADSRYRLAQLFEFREEFARAEESYQRQLEALTEHFNSSDATLIEPLTNLAFVAGKSGESARDNPISYLRRALAISETALGAEHVRTAGVLELMGNALEQREKNDEAQPFRERALAIRKQNIRQLAAKLSPASSADLPGERIGDGVSAPRLLGKVEPEYSDEARRAGQKGTVVVSVLIDRQGRAGNFELIRGLGLGLDEKAVEAISKWRFEPGARNGEPVAVKATVEVNFRLYHL